MIAIVLLVILITTNATRVFLDTILGEMAQVNFAMLVLLTIICIAIVLHALLIIIPIP